MADALTSGGTSSGEGNGPVRIRGMRAAEAGVAADWHRDEFPNGFYVRLGPRFLTAYYRGFVRSPHATALVAVSAEDQVIGYLAGTTNDGKHNRWMLSHYGLVVVAVGLACLLRRPGLWTEFLRSRALWYLRRALRVAVRPAGGRSGELTYLVCSPDFRGQGVGSRLVRIFDQYAGAAGTERLTLVTAADDQRVRSFYRSLGWRLTGTRWTKEGRELAAFESQPSSTGLPTPHRSRRATIRRSLVASTAIAAFASACAVQTEVGHAPSESPEGISTTTPPSTPTVKPTTPAPEPPSRPAADARIVAVPARQWAKIVATGTWRPGCPVTRTQLRRVEINHYDFAGKVRRGVLVVHADTAASTARIFTRLFDAKFPIRQMRPVEEYSGDNTRSMAANNTAAYNCRRPTQINAPVKASPHANGRAIDVNPDRNPWIDLRCKCWQPTATYSKKRTGPGVVTKGSLPWRLFTEEGWIWQNIDIPDYMHFDTGYPSRPLSKR
ncbi:GNAT family N-acetyltransferase [Kribbella sp. DT2]|uniref:GNAT family N-acetyltransferase n=1 Tax=Kribbella sp. DT2 TaxID=3393427 RepID=UPI003CEDD9DB